MPGPLAILGPLLIPIAKKLIRFGASKLAGKLIDGPAAETVAGPIVDAVFDRFGIDPAAGDVGAAVDDLITNRGGDIGIIVDQVAASNRNEWADLWKTQVADVNMTMRAEHGAKSVLSRIWRPIFGFGFTLIYVLLGISFAAAVLRSPDPLNALVNVSGLIMAFVGSGAAVLGVQVWSRGEEKKAGVA